MGDDQAKRGVHAMARVDAPGKSVLTIPRVQRFIDRMIEGEELKEAAKAEGLRIRRARAIMADAAVRRTFFAGIDNIRQSTRARNVLLGKQIVERALAPGSSAADRKVGVEAARYLDGVDARSGPSVSVSVNAVVGYVMDLREPDDEGRLAPARPGGPVIDAEVVSREG